MLREIACTPTGELVSAAAGALFLVLWGSVCHVIVAHVLIAQIYYLRSGEVEEAHSLISDMEPSSPPEYILKGVVNASIGQANGSRENLKLAQQHFQLVGASASECDTIPGRQCMASCFFLLKQFEDVNIYLKSVKAYMYNDDAFNWNFGISLANVGDYKAAEEHLLLVQSERYQREYCYLSWLARCYIMNGKARLAWEIYLVSFIRIFVCMLCGNKSINGREVYHQ